MDVTFTCPECEQTDRAEIDDEFSCAHCNHIITIPRDAITNGQVRRCVVCSCEEVFIRKNFPQRLGVTIVVLGLAASCIPWYYQQWLPTFAILFATAILDFVLYLFMGNLVECYRCHAQYRGIMGTDEHAGFDLEVHERYRQQAARMKEIEKQQDNKITSA